MLRHSAYDGSGAFYVPDYKTTDCAHPDKVARSVSDWGYHIQGWWYRQACIAAGRGPDVRFALVVQEKSAPPKMASCLLLHHSKDTRFAQQIRDCLQAQNRKAEDKENPTEQEYSATDVLIAVLSADFLADEVGCRLLSL